MGKVLITNENGENGNLEEQGNEVDEHNNYTRTYLSKWPNRIIALTAIGTLIVTGVLAFFTYRSLDEVKKQRDLTYKQFVMANRPNVNMGFEGSGLRLNEKIGYIDWRIANGGGDVEDLIYRTILFHIKSESKSDYSINEFYVRNMQQKYLNRGTRKSIHSPIEDVKTLKKINDILAMDKRTNGLGVYIRVEYTIPAELTLDGIPRKDSRFQILIWNKIDKRFENVKMSFFERMVEKISETNLNSLEDQG
ncbi:MAG: hypothetical protein HQ552_11600 [Desulfobacteraceae bacterium]|nr:hypothetical protein [Desulfobacteraceae bacterium]